MTTSLAQTAGEPARQATQGGDETATSAYHFATGRRTLKSSARWYSNLMQAHRNTGGPA